MTAEGLRAIAAQHAEDAEKYERMTITQFGRTLLGTSGRPPLQHDHRGALLDHMRALAQPMPYRPGLPTVEQVRAHEERGGWWMYLEADEMPQFEKWRVDGNRRLMHPVRQTRWENAEKFADSDKYSFCPCLPDGTPCAWPGEPDPWAALEALR